MWKKKLEMKKELLNSMVINEFECIHLLYQVKVVVMENIVVKIDGQQCFQHTKVK